MKKEFIKPEIDVIELEAQEIICSSSTNSGVGGLDHAPEASEGDDDF